GDELDVHARGRIRGLRVVDQLGQILDRVDVVVRGRGDQADAGGGVPGAGDPRIHLLGRQLTALAGLGALGDLDLDIAREGEVLAGHAEAARGDLLDGAAPFGVAQTLRILPALAAVGHTAQPVHGDRE